MPQSRANLSHIYIRKSVSPFPPQDTGAMEELGEAEGKETIQRSAGVDRGHEAQRPSCVRLDLRTGLHVHRVTVFETELREGVT